jgi:hypothetical protein
LLARTVDFDFVTWFVNTLLTVEFSTFFFV